MKKPLTWTDQPEVLDGAEVICTGSAKGDGHFEVRKTDDNEWYITLGNLFHSETVKCDNAEVVLRTIGAVYERRGSAPVNLPPGAALVRKAGA